MRSTDKFVITSSSEKGEVLIFLLEHAGEVVTREELQKRLWPDTFVDGDPNLNTAINKILRCWATRRRVRDSSKRCHVVDFVSSPPWRATGQ
jgi:DNA-binding winged helix-turn-helix (wHTH) protein